MNVTRITTIAACGALATWLAAAATSGNRDRVERPVVGRAPIDTQGDVLAGEISRLHDRLRPTVAPRQPSRNLLTFSPRQTPVPSLPPHTAVTAVPEDVAPRPALPSLKLSGIAEDVTASGVVRTAIISAQGQVFLVKEGESVMARYRVAKISSDVVELSDATDGSSLRLALK